MLKEYVISTVDSKQYYAKRFPQWNIHTNENIRCCFHDDGKPSLHVNLRGGGARCHASTCNASIGNIVHFESRLTGKSEITCARKLYHEFVRKTISKKKIEELRQNLACSPNYILKISKEMGLRGKSISRFRLGLDAETSRITIPIYNQYGLCTNIRYYRLPSERGKQTNAKIYNHTVTRITSEGEIKDSYGGCDSFPAQEIKDYPIDVPVYVMASEKETMLARVHDMPAVCSTSGEGSFPDDWGSLFAGRTVYLVYDQDKGGDSATAKFKAQFATVAKRIKRIHLPFSRARADWKDFADWVIKDKGDVRRLIKKYNKKISNNSTKQIKHPKVNEGSLELPDFASDEQMDIVNISSRADLLNKRIKTQGIVAAKSSNTYSIPWKFRIKIAGRKSFTFELPAGRELLRFVRASDIAIVGVIRELVGHAQAEAIPLAYITATEVEIIPTAVVDRDVPYKVQRCFYLGENIDSNIPYYFEIIPTPEIRTQETIGIITHCVPLSRSIEQFVLDAETRADLMWFRPDGGETVWDKLKSLANEISIKHTRIFNRIDWHLVALLTWASPIGFRFPGEPDVQRGWINSLALGDTETGKSKVCRTFQKIFNCGVFVNAENCTYVGLVGGAIKMGSGQLMLRWGRIPLSDKQLVVLEELSGLSIEEISNMSDVRSSGIARLDKGGINSETNSRTRILCLSNVRAQRKSLSSYLFGVLAIQDLIGHAEDIARFDLITTLVDYEVGVDIINERPDFATVANSDSNITPRTLEILIHFIWSLTPDQVIFTEEARDECLDQTKKLSAIYHPSIPIFKGGSGRYKIARIGAAIACLQFSVRKDGRVYVLKNHIRAASKLLRLIYNKPSFGYLEWSRQNFDRENVKDTVLLEKEFRAHISRETLPKVLETMIHATRFSRDELCAIGSMSILYSDRLIGAMLRERAVRKGEANQWEVTPAGKKWIDSFYKKLTNRNK